jgi:hypothetical protein
MSLLWYNSEAIAHLQTKRTPRPQKPLIPSLTTVSTRDTVIQGGCGSCWTNGFSDPTEQNPVPSGRPLTNSASGPRGRRGRGRERPTISRRERPLLPRYEGYQRRFNPTSSHSDASHLLAHHPATQHSYAPVHDFANESAAEGPIAYPLRQNFSVPPHRAYEQRSQSTLHPGSRLYGRPDPQQYVQPPTNSSPSYGYTGFCPLGPTQSAQQPSPHRPDRQLPLPVPSPHITHQNWSTNNAHPVYPVTSGSTPQDFGRLSGDRATSRYPPSGFECDAGSPGHVSTPAAENSYSRLSATGHISVPADRNSAGVPSFVSHQSFTAYGEPTSHDGHYSPYLHYPSYQTDNGSFQPYLGPAYSRY